MEVAQKAGTEARLIETKNDIDYDWLEGASTVGVTAGASTPELLVQEAITALAASGFSRVAQLETAEENVVFPLPLTVVFQPSRASQRDAPTAPPGTLTSNSVPLESSR